jgi:hypothetical protein
MFLGVLSVFLFYLYSYLFKIVKYYLHHCKRFSSLHDPHLCPTAEPSLAAHLVPHEINPPNSRIINIGSIIEF